MLKHDFPILTTAAISSRFKKFVTVSQLLYVYGAFHLRSFKNTPWDSSSSFTAITGFTDWNAKYEFGCTHVHLRQVPSLASIFDQEIAMEGEDFSSELLKNEQGRGW